MTVKVVYLPSFRRWFVHHPPRVGSSDMGNSIMVIRLGTVVPTFRKDFNMEVMYGSSGMTSFGGMTSIKHLGIKRGIVSFIQGSVRSFSVALPVLCPTMILYATDRKTVEEAFYHLFQLWSFGM